MAVVAAAAAAAVVCIFRKRRTVGEFGSDRVCTTLAVLFFIFVRSAWIGGRCLICGKNGTPACWPSALLLAFVLPFFVSFCIFPILQFGIEPNGGRRGGAGGRLAVYGGAGVEERARALLRPGGTLPRFTRGLRLLSPAWLGN